MNNFLEKWMLLILVRISIGIGLLIIRLKEVKTIKKSIRPKVKNEYRLILMEVLVLELATI